MGGVGNVWGSAPYVECLDYFRAEDTRDPLGPNVKGYLPGLSFSAKNRQPSTTYLQNAAYIKLKNVQFGYSFPKKIVNKMRLGALRLYTSLENLWTGTKMFKTIDPEMLKADARFYPLSAIYSFGMNITF